MLSKSLKRELMGEYSSARKNAEEVASRVEDASVSVTGAGPSFTQRSKHLVDTANELCAQLGMMIKHLDSIQGGDGER